LGLGSAGCSKSGPVRGDVSGTVTFKKQPVTEGKISFYSPATGYGGSADLDATGNYVIKTLEGGLPLGEYVVTVTPLTYMDHSDQKPLPADKENPAPNIPEKYRRPGTSPLKAEVKEGKNEFPFDMTR